MDEMQEYYDYYIKNGGLLEDVPEEFITQEMCDKYIAKGGHLRYVPKMFITQEMCDKFFVMGGHLRFIPEEFITREMCDKYFEMKHYDICKLPRKFITQEMCDKYIAKGGKLRYVPRKFITQEMCDIFLARGGRLTFIPQEFVTQEMCDKFFERERYNIGIIPEEFITSEMCYRYIASGGYLEKVPEEFLTRELYYVYIKKSGSLNDVPIEFITREMCEEYMARGGYLEEVPDEFITREMCDKYIANGGYLGLVPEEFLTKEMCLYYFNSGRELKEIYPEDITKLMCEVWFEIKKTLIQIPTEFISQEMCDAYIASGGYLEKVPSEFLTKELYSIYIDKGGDLKEVPYILLTEEMCSTYIKNGGYLSCVPKRFVTSELFADYSVKNGTINGIPNFLDNDKGEEIYFDLMMKKYGLQYLKLSSMEAKASEIFRCLLIDKSISNYLVLDFIPEKYYSKKMINAYLNKVTEDMDKSRVKKYTKEFYSKLFTDTKNVNLIPRQYLTDEMIEYAINNPDMVLSDSDVGEYLDSVYEKESAKEQVERELYNLPETLKTKEQLASEYGVSVSFIDNILDNIKEKYPLRYAIILKTLNENSLRFKEIMIRNIKKMSAIIDCLGDIAYNSKLHNVGRNARGLNTSQKIRFAYLLKKSGIFISKLHKVYEALGKEWIIKDAGIQEDEMDKVKRFFDVLYVDTKRGSFQNLSKSERFAVMKNHSLQYLRKYTPKEYFYDDKGNGVKRSILDINDNVIKLTEENSKEVIDILIDNDIPLLNCIVNEAFRIYFREGLDSLNSFIDELHSYDVFAQAVREYAGDVKLRMERCNHKIMVIDVPTIACNEKDTKKLVIQHKNA